MQLKKRLLGFRSEDNDGEAIEGKFQRMKLSSGNLSAWLAIIVLLAVIGVLSSFVVSFFRGEADEVASVTVPKMVEVSMANQSISEAYIATLRAVIADNPDERDAFIREVADRSARTTARLKAYGELPLSEEEQMRFKRLTTDRQRYFDTRDQVLSALRNGQREVAQQLSQTDLQSRFAAYDELSTEMLEAHAATLRAGADSVSRRASVLQIMTGSISSALFLLAFLLGLSAGLILVPAGRTLGAEKPSNSASLIQRED